MAPCLICGKPGPGARCSAHARPDSYGREMARLRPVVLAEEPCCWLCGEGARAGDPWVVDHIVPLAEGGRCVRSNLAKAHRSCNARRGQEMTAVA